MCGKWLNTSGQFKLSKQNGLVIENICMCSMVEQWPSNSVSSFLLTLYSKVVCILHEKPSCLTKDVLLTHYHTMLHCDTLKIYS